MEITLRTVGDFVDHEHELMIACSGVNCGEHRGVDLAELAGRLGSDRDLYSDPPPLARCPRCGSPSKLYVFRLPGAGEVRTLLATAASLGPGPSDFDLQPSRTAGVIAKRRLAIEANGGI